MPIDDRERAESNLRALRRARAVLEGELERLHEQATSRSNSPVAELNWAIALALPRRLHAIEMLVDAGLGPEGEAIARGLVEAALSLSWVGDSSDRALQMLAKGPRDQVRMLRKAQAAGFRVSDELIAQQEQVVDRVLQGRALPDAPRIWDRAQQTIGLNAEQATDLYALPFARQSAAVHLDTVHIQQIARGADTIPMLLHDTVAATSFILAFIANALDGGAAFVEIVEVLQAELRTNVGQ